MEVAPKLTLFGRIQNNMINAIVLQSFTFLSILVGLSFMHIFDVGLSPVMLVEGGLTSILLFLFVFRKYVSTKEKAMLVCTTVFGVGICTIHLQGLASPGLFLFLCSTAIACVFINPVTGLFLCILGTMVTVTYFTLVNVFEHTFLLTNSTNHSMLLWLTMIATYLYLSFMLCVLIGRLTSIVSKQSEAQNRKKTHGQSATDFFKEILNELIHNFPVSVAWKDHRLQIQGANNLYLKEHGFKSQSDVLHKTSQDILKPDEAETQQEIEDSLRTGLRDKYRYEKCFITANEYSVKREIRHIAMRTSTGAFIGVLVASLDIPTKIKTNADSGLGQTENEKLQIAKSQFLANLSHEIKTPLNGVQGNLGLLSQSDLSTKQRAYVGNTEQSVSVLNQVLSDLLDLSQIEANELKIERIPFNAVELMNKLTAVYRAQCNEKGLEFVIDFAKQDYPTFISDPARIYQIVANLLSNAVKFTQSGVISIKIQIELRLGAALLRICIADTGLGIDSDYIATLFDTFTQADSSRTRKYGGAGLGLALVKRLIDKMNGDISVKSEVNVGSQFSVNLPLVISKRAIDNMAADKRHKKLKLLLVEDNAINQEIALSMLGDDNFEVSVAEDGVQAVHAVSNDKFDLVLMDIQMPNMDGLDATIEIRKAHTLEKLPIIAVTANVMASDIDNYMENGFNAHVSKPFSKTSLLDQIRETVSELIDRRTADYF